MSDRGLIAAFDKGKAAAHADKPRSANPYLPSTEEEYWQAWYCGFNEVEPRYVLSGNLHRPPSAAVVS